MKNIPEIRLKGFEGEWYYKKFIDIAMRISYTSVLDILPRVEYEDIVSREGKLNKNIYDKKSSKIGIEFQPGDILYGKLRPYLKNILLANFSGIAVGDFWVFRSKNVATIFLYIVINTEKFDKIANISVGSKMPRADWNLVSNSSFYIPPRIEEQQAIGTFFQNLDNLIMEQKNKLENLQKVKKSMLCKMFPKEGQKIPEIRFKGFEGNWKLITLGNVGLFHSNGVDKKIYPNEHMVNLLNYMDIYNGRIVNKKNCNSLMQVSANDRQLRDCNVLANDIFFTPSSETVEDVGHIMVIEEDLPNTCYSYHLMRFRPYKGIFYSTFPNYGFQTSFVRHQMRLMANGVQRFVLGKTEFESLQVLIPSYDEQKKIAKYFTSIETQITFQTQRLKKLKQIKSACLQKMFV